VRKGEALIAAGVALALFAASAAALVAAGPDPQAPAGAEQVAGRTAALTQDDALRIFGREAAAKMATSPIPVLAPASLTREQAAELGRKFRATSDGYFASFHHGAYDVVFNGSKGAGAAAGGADRPDASRVRVSQEDTGLSTSFTLRGAEYQVEFACRGPGSEAGATCLTPDEARAFIGDLVVISGGP
jgi:hypothetical protein